MLIKTIVILNQTAVNNFERFHPNLKLEDITIEFLENFERWMLSRGKSITTVGMHIRTLRAVLNIAKENGAITQQGYPFGRRKYIIPTGKNTKKALNIYQIEQIFDYPTTNYAGHHHGKIQRFLDIELSLQWHEHGRYCQFKMG